MTDTKRGEKSEGLILEELRHHSGGGLISRRFLKEELSPGNMAERTLDRALNRLEEKGLIVRVETADRGMFFGIAEDADERAFVVEHVKGLGKRGITKKRLAAARGKTMVTAGPPFPKVTLERMIENYEDFLEEGINRYPSRPHRERIRKIAENELAKLKRQVEESKRSP